MSTSLCFLFFFFQLLIYLFFEVLFKTQQFQPRRIFARLKLLSLFASNGALRRGGGEPRQSLRSEAEEDVGPAPIQLGGGGQRGEDERRRESKKKNQTGSCRAAGRCHR